MKKTIVLFVIAIVLMCGAGVFAAYQVGYLAPILGRDSGMEGDTQKSKGQGKSLSSPIETENTKLKKEKKDLEYQLAKLEGEKTKLLEQATELQTDLTKLKIDITQQKTAGLNAEELAACYQEMKPGAVVEIMDNLDDEVVLIILPLLDKKQTGKVLALMEPQRAAIITQLLLDKNIQQ